MSNDDEWVNDVRRWYFGGHPPPGEAPEGSECRDEHAVGFEAAAPSSVGGGERASAAFDSH